MRRTVLWVLTFVLVMVPGSYAQEDGLSPARVELAASDGLMLVGDYYAPAGDEPVPGVILLHMLSSQRSAWEPLLPVLVDEYQFAVLNVDMRGHGETGGSREWALAEDDLQLWIDWLRQQDGVDPDAISLVGASIGSNMAIRGWANDQNVVTAVALSPGLDYQGVTTADAVEANSERPIMLVAARNDRASAAAINDLYDLTEGYAVVRMYDGRLHGTNMFGRGTDPADYGYLLDAIAAWIDENS